MIRRRKPLRRNSKPIQRKAPLRRGKPPKAIRYPAKAELDRLATIAACCVRGARCQYPGCPTTIVDPHHTVPRAREGTRWDVDNLILVCRDHHNACHRVPKWERQAFYLEKFGVDRMSLEERAARNPKPDLQEVKRGLLAIIAEARR